MQIQVVFQGGGAKLAALLGAVEGLYEQQAKSQFDISRVSGTSAGAIAACILATGKDPRIFVERLKSIGPRHLTAISKELSELRVAWNVYVGRPMFDPIAYRRFLADLFTFPDGSFTKIDDLLLDVQIHSVDIRDGSPKIYCKGQGTSIADALYDSSALPFVFATYKDAVGICDGGLINNFPSGSLREDAESGPIIGFSFEPRPFAIAFDNVKDFALALSSTMIDHSSKRSMETLPQECIHIIKTDLQTMDFKKAVSTLDTAEYRNIRMDASNFVGNFVAAKRASVAKVSADEFSLKTLDLYNALTVDQSIKTNKVTLVYKSNSLYHANADAVDDVELTMNISVLKGAARCYGMRVSLDERAPGAQNFSVSVSDENGDDIATTVFPIGKAALSSEEDNNILIFFHSDLKPDHEYTISLVGRMQEILYDLVGKNQRDYLAYCLRNMDEVDEVNIVAHIPQSLTAPTLTTWAPSKYKLVNGVELGQKELKSLAVVPFGFQAIGWQGKELKRGEAVGFVAYAQIRIASS